MKPELLKPEGPHTPDWPKPLWPDSGGGGDGKYPSLPEIRVSE